MENIEALTVDGYIFATPEDAEIAKNEIRKIVDLELGAVIKRLTGLGYDITVTDAAKEFLGVKGYDKQYGARPLKRAVQQYVEDMLCEQMLEHQGETGVRITIDKDPDTDSTVARFEKTNT